MKKGIFKFLSGLVVGVAITLLALFVILPKQMFVVNESKLGFDETVATIVKSAADNNWSVPHQYDLQAAMKKHDLEVNPVTVFSLCKPDHSFEILKRDEERLVSALMPCRIAVYEKNGKTFISMLNSGLFSKLMGSKINEVMSLASEENLKILEPVIRN